MLKKIANIIMIVVLLFTILPLKQVGKLLSGSQLTEEIAHSDQPEKKPNKACNLDFCSFGYRSEANPHHLISQLQFAEYASHLPVTPAGEILVPPPNFS
jgi:hypothetical protein